MIRWVGVDIDLRELWFVTASIPKLYCEAVAALAAGMLNRKSVDLAEVQKLAGKAGWAAGISPVIWSFVAPLWAASADTEKFYANTGVMARAAKAKKKVVKIGLCRVRPTLAWTCALFSSGTGIIARRMPVRWRGNEVKARMHVDASPCGYGAS